MIEIFVDGASKGNPGPSGAGAVALDPSGRELFSISRFLGVRTNNEAEYLALIEALKKAKEFGIKRIIIKSDSQLLVKQLKGEYKVKAGNLIPLATMVKGLLSGFESWEVVHIPRNENRKADHLANLAIKGGEAGLSPLYGEESPGSRGQGAG